MSITEKIKATNNKVARHKAQHNLDNSLLRFRLYHQEMLVNMNF